MAAETLPTLTLYGAWALGITVLGKRVENRPERFARMVAGQVGDGWLAIHAGKNVGARKGWPGTYEELDALADMALTQGWDMWSDRRDDDGNDISPDVSFTFARGEYLATIYASEITTSAVVAVCRVRGVLPPGLVHPWKVTSSAALKLDDVRVLPEPVPCGGHQGLWRLPPDIFAAVKAQGVLGA